MPRVRVQPRHHAVARDDHARGVDAAAGEEGRVVEPRFAGRSALAPRVEHAVVQNEYPPFGPVESRAHVGGAAAPHPLQAPARAGPPAMASDRIESVRCIASPRIESVRCIESARRIEA
eukprot:CAMPEP_0206836410 /NCGR_PEP_ID=MMETSP0975-20121206/19883_1 /ASSEMBLY_ACC=CAM_ASM_000399 /TAXON_ID=483370 /ORGANISM="non described non described, Strain CCMP2097" /LENGTH=118 /DNA_ID=CAMNT_0054378811 /DNA_START=205 /DNA_END=559 /DNA_ORIENTATION=+